MAPPQYSCQACGAECLRAIAGFEDLPRVTSDSKPFGRGGRLLVCERCGLVQKIVDADWLREIGEIYRDYEMYHQSASHDQAIFDPVSGRPRGRCEALVRHLLASGILHRSGARDGRMHLGLPILRPAQVPQGAVVYLAFVRDVSDAISRRLADLPIRFAEAPAKGA